jgi:short-subunit dehydrogenase
VNFPLLLSYSASKAALHSLTQGLRSALKRQATQVFGVYPGPVDTDMAAKVPFEKTPPDVVAFLKSPKALEEQLAASAA